MKRNIDRPFARSKCVYPNLLLQLNGAAVEPDSAPSALGSSLNSAKKHQLDDTLADSLPHPKKNSVAIIEDGKLASSLP